MARSMTGFGLGIFGSDQLQLQCEIHSGNHRRLSIEVNLPTSLAALENKIIQRLEKSFYRGRLTITIRFAQGSMALERFNVNETLAHHAIHAWKRIADKEGLDQAPDIGVILQLPGILEKMQEVVDMESAWALLSQALEQAIDSCLTMRTQEGNRLYAEILGIADRIGSIVSEIELVSRDRCASARQKVENRLKDLLEPLPVDPILVLNEAALLATKADITEELDRLRSHLASLSDLEQEQEKTLSPGRKLDFIAQEILREGNTIASKATVWEISNQAVQLRALSEAIRQQAANLE